MRFHIEYAWGIDNKKYTALAEKLAATKIKTEIERTGELSGWIYMPIYSA